MNIDKWDEYGLECDQHLYPELGRVKNTRKRHLSGNRLDFLKGWRLPITEDRF